MLITKSQLTQIIKEEIRKALNENITLSQDEINKSSNNSLGVYTGYDSSVLKPNSVHEIIKERVAKSGFKPIELLNLTDFKKEKYTVYKNISYFFHDDERARNLSEYVILNITYNNSEEINVSFTTLEHEPNYSMTTYSWDRKPYVWYHKNPHEINETFNFIDFLKYIDEELPQDYNDYYEEKILRTPSAEVAAKRAETEKAQGQARLAAQAKQFEPQVNTKAAGGSQAQYASGRASGRMFETKNRKK